MIGREECEAILGKALSLSTAQEADFFLSVEELALTRFAGNAIHQNVSHASAQLHIAHVAARATAMSCASCEAPAAGLHSTAENT